jgi:hypothetical protein
VKDSVIAIPRLELEQPLSVYGTKGTSYGGSCVAEVWFMMPYQNDQTSIVLIKKVVEKPCFVTGETSTLTQHIQAMKCLHCDGVIDVRC